MTSMTSVRIITRLRCQEPGFEINHENDPHPSVTTIVDAQEGAGIVEKLGWSLWVVCKSVCSSCVSDIDGIDDQLQRDSRSF